MELLHLLCLPQSTNPNRTHRTSEFDTCPRHHETPPLTTFRAPPNLPVTGSRRPKPQPTRVPAMAHRAPRRATSVEEVVPFRSSKLTFLLRDSLAGNSRSRMAPWATRDGGTEGRREGGGFSSGVVWTLDITDVLGGECRVLMAFVGVRASLSVWGTWCFAPSTLFSLSGRTTRWTPVQTYIHTHAYSCV